MPNIMSRLQGLGEVMTQYGTHMALSLGVLIVGLLVVRWIDRGLRRTMPRKPAVTLICNIVYIVLVMIVISAAAVELGAKPVNVFRFLSIVSLAVIGLMIFMRPFLPSMPFKVGNTIKANDLLGKVEAITFVNTRLRTFDGKTLFVPNRKILNDVVTNYHFTATRRIKIDVNIRYDQDLLKAKRVLEAVMLEDARVKTKPAPIVYVLNLASGSVELGGRCWVDNEDFWGARCEIIEKTKLRFDREGIQFALPQLELHFNPTESKIAVLDDRCAHHA